MKQPQWKVLLDPSRPHESSPTVPVSASEADVEEGGALTFRDDDGVIVAAFAGGANPVWLSVQRLS